VQAPSQLFLDLVELRLQAVAPGFPLELELALANLPQMKVKPRKPKVAGCRARAGRGDPPRIGRTR